MTLTIRPVPIAPIVSDAGRLRGWIGILAGMDRRPVIAMFPGSFDPITNGHLDVIRRGRLLFEKLVVAIGQNPAKTDLFSLDERRDMIGKLIEDETMENVEVHTYQGLTVDYARSIQAAAILRGLRNVTDLNFEFQLALTNRAVADIETVFIMTGEAYAFTSSSLIKQIAAGGEIRRLHRLLPPLVLRRLDEKKQRLGSDMSQIRIDGLKE